MRYGSKLNTALLAVLVVMAAVAWYMQRDVRGLEPLLAEFVWDDVDEIRVELRGRDPLVFERGPGGWRMREPLEIDVDPRRLEEIVAGINVPSRAQYTTREVEPDELGLGDDPLARLSIDGAGYLIGDTNPVSGWRYVQRGEVVHMTHDVLYFRLLGEPQSWARRQPLPVGTRIARIEVDGVTVVRTADGWAMEPDDAEVGADALQRMVDAWANAQAYQVRRHTDDAPFDRTARVWLDGAAAPLVYGLRETDSGLLVVRTDTEVEYQLPAYRAADFWRPPPSDAP